MQWKVESLLLLALLLISILILSLKDCIWPPSYFRLGNGKWLLPLAAAGLLYWNYCLLVREGQNLQQAHQVSLEE
jgi:hypothetical protein